MLTERPTSEFTGRTILLILSDLHLEFAAFDTPDPAKYDVVVLVGDVYTAQLHAAGVV